MSFGRQFQISLIFIAWKISGDDYKAQSDLEDLGFTTQEAKDKVESWK